MFSVDQYNAAHHSAVVIVRSSLGTIGLDKSLSRGQFRQVTEDEIESLLRPAPETAAP